MSPFLILFGNYWVFGQLVWVTLDLGAQDAIDDFEKLFLTGLAVFGETIGLPPPSWADDIEAWAREDE